MRTPTLPATCIHTHAPSFVNRHVHTQQRKVTGRSLPQFRKEMRPEARRVDVAWTRRSKAWEPARGIEVSEPWKERKGEREKERWRVGASKCTYCEPWKERKGTRERQKRTADLVWPPCIELASQWCRNWRWRLIRTGHLFNIFVTMLIPGLETDPPSRQTTMDDDI